MIPQNEAQQPNLYSGYVGLNTNLPDFANHVMQPAEVINLLRNGQRFAAPYVYPFLVSDGFDRRTIFSAHDVTDSGFMLHAEVITNRHPHTCAAWFASKTLPAQYTVIDHIIFQPKKDGFGDGSYTITTVDVKDKKNKSLACTKGILGVKNRPGLFLKVANRNGGFHEDTFIFFPDKAKGLFHSSVKNGEAFVFVKEEMQLQIPQEMLEDIIAAFDKLVKRSYGEHQGLYAVDTHKPVEAADEVPASCFSCK